MNAEQARREWRDAFMAEQRARWAVEDVEREAAKPDPDKLFRDAVKMAAATSAVGAAVGALVGFVLGKVFK